MGGRGEYEEGDEEDEEDGEHEQAEPRNERVRQDRHSLLSEANLAGEEFNVGPGGQLPKSSEVQEVNGKVSCVQLASEGRSGTCDKMRWLPGSSRRCRSRE